MQVVRAIIAAAAASVAMASDPAQMVRIAWCVTAHKLKPLVVLVQGHHHVCSRLVNQQARMPLLAFWKGLLVLRRARDACEIRR